MLFCSQASNCLELYSSTKIFPYSPRDITSLREQLLKNPDRVLLESTLFLDENTSSEIAEYSKKNPFIGYLSECLSPICPLNRAKKPIYREKFDNYSAQLLYNYSNHGTKRVRYLSYAGGELFGDLIIAAKALDKGVKQLDIYVIEPSYAPYTIAAQAILDNYLTSYYAHCISSTKAFLTQLLKSPLETASCLIEKYAPSLRTQRFNTAQELREQDLVKNPALQHFFRTQKSNPVLIARTIAYQNERFKQFLEFFAYAYPQAQVRLFIYNSPEEYLNASKANTLDMALLADPEQKDQALLTQNFKNIARSRLKIGGKAVLLAKPPALITYLKATQDILLESKVEL